MYIGKDNINEWQTCDVIEGACSVQCGGPNTLVCDTREWTYTHPRESSGWLDVKVIIEIVGDEGAGETVEVVLGSAYFYYSISDYRSPMLVDVSPNAISSEGALVLTGMNFGYWLQDYRTVYVGTGAAPQGGNIKTTSSDVQTEATHATCRPDEVFYLLPIVRVFAAKQKICAHTVPFFISTFQNIIFFLIVSCFVRTKHSPLPYQCS